MSLRTKPPAMVICVCCSKCRDFMSYWYVPVANKTQSFLKENISQFFNSRIKINGTLGTILGHFLSCWSVACQAIHIVSIISMLAITDLITCFLILLQIIPNVVHSLAYCSFWLLVSFELPSKNELSLVSFLSINQKLANKNYQFLKTIKTG